MKFQPKTKSDWMHSARAKKENEQYTDAHLEIMYDEYVSNVNKGIEAARALGGDWSHDIKEMGKADIDEIVSAMTM